MYERYVKYSATNKEKFIENWYHFGRCKSKNQYSIRDIVRFLVSNGRYKFFSLFILLQINIFLLTLSEYQPKVSVSGFYEINRSLFGGVSINEYILILIFFLISVKYTINIRQNEFNKRNVTLKRIYYYAFDEGVT